MWKGVFGRFWAERWRVVSGGWRGTLSTVMGFGRVIVRMEVVGGGEAGTSMREVLVENVSGMVPSMIQLSGVGEVMEAKRR